MCDVVFSALLLLPEPLCLTPARSCPFRVSSLHTPDRVAMQTNTSQAMTFFLLSYFLCAAHICTGFEIMFSQTCRGCLLYVQNRCTFGKYARQGWWGTPVHLHLALSQILHQPRRSHLQSRHPSLCSDTSHCENTSVWGKDCRKQCLGDAMTIVEVT